MKKLHLLPLLAAAAVACPAFAGDFTLPSNGSVTVNGAIFQSTSFQTAGTGVIQPFLRIQANGTETGYNTSAGAPQDDKAGLFTHDLLFNSLAVVNIGGTNYYQFGIDLNESNGGTGPAIDLTKFDVYTSPTAAGNSSTFTAPAGSTLDYTLGVHDINMTDINSGSGQGDVLINIPVSVFTNNTYLILNATFTGSDGGFEEFQALQGTSPTTVPDSGTTMALLGASLAGIEVMRRKFAKRS